MKRYLSLRKHEQTRDNQAVQNTGKKYKSSINIQYLFSAMEVHDSQTRCLLLLAFSFLMQAKTIKAEA